MTELATWQSHKKVRAGEITRIDAVYTKEGEAPTSFRVHCKAADERAGVVIIEAPYGTFARLIAETGGTTTAIGEMLVIYASGYVTWSPKAEFDEGYTLLGVPDGTGRYIGLDRGEETRT